MSDFNKCVDFVFSNEGGFVVDDGGATNWGITAKYLMASRLWKYDFNKDGYIDQSDMKLFSKKDATDVYQSLFNRNHYNMLDSDDIAMRVFDMCVNSGYPIANKMLQSCYNNLLGVITAPKDLLKIKRLLVDGMIGKVTIAAINSLCAKDTNSLVLMYKAARSNYYKELAERNPGKYRKDAKGWQKRAYE
jgi:lysozyme family protein